MKNKNLSMLLTLLLLAGVALLVCGATIMSPDKTKYDGEMHNYRGNYTSEFASITKVLDGNPAYQEVQYKVCDFGDYGQVLKYHVVVPNSECELPFGHPTGVWSWHQYVMLVIGGLLMLVALLVGLWVNIEEERP